MGGGRVGGELSDPGRRGGVLLLPGAPRPDLWTQRRRRGGVGFDQTLAHVRRSEVARLMGPLSGVRVLTVENFVSAPMATMWLADAGADVVKVEIPGFGDTSRGVQPVRER